MMCGAFSVATSLPSLVTASVCLPASRPSPSNTVTLFLRNRCATPEESCFATARERFTTLSSSKRGLSAAFPPFSEREAGVVGAEAEIAEVMQEIIDFARAQQRLGGMQPQFRQMP